MTSSRSSAPRQSPLGRGTRRPTARADYYVNLWRSRIHSCATLGQVESEVLARVRGIALALPRVSERRSHGAPCFFVGSRPIGYFHDHHRGDDRVALWCPARAGVQAAYVVAEPERYFAPQPSARGTFSNWLGTYLDLAGEPGVEWDEITLLLEEAFRQMAPSAALAELDRRRV